MAKTPTRLPIDFNAQKPDNLLITDPERAERESAGIPTDREYPKHVHKFAGHGQIHEYKEVKNAKEESDARKDGWGTPGEATAHGHKLKAAESGEKAPKAAKKAAAKKPAAPKAAKPSKVKKESAPPAADV